MEKQLVKVEEAKDRACPFRFYGYKNYHYLYCLANNCMAWYSIDNRGYCILQYHKEINPIANQSNVLGEGI